MQNNSGLEDRLPAIDNPVSGDQSNNEVATEESDNAIEGEQEDFYSQSQEMNLDQAAQIIAELEAKVQHAAREKRPPSSGTTAALQNILASNGKQYRKGLGTVSEQAKQTHLRREVPQKSGSRHSVKAPNTKDRELPSESPRVKAHIRDLKSARRAVPPPQDANLAFLLSQASETSVGVQGGEIERGNSQTHLANKDGREIRSPEESSLRGPKPQRESLNHSTGRGQRKPGIPGQATAPGGRQHQRAGAGVKQKKNPSPAVAKKSAREANLYQVQLEDHLDDLSQELSEAQRQLAAWKLRYYVEYFRLDGTKKYVKELQDQHSSRDEEISRLNSYIDNIVEQNQQRVDYYTGEMEKKEQLSDSLQEQEERVAKLEMQLKEDKERHESEGEAHLRDIATLRDALTREQEAHDRAKESLVKLESDYHEMQEVLKLEHADTHETYKQKMTEAEEFYKAKLSEAEETLDKKKEEHIYMSSKSSAAELAKEQMMKKFVETEAQREILEADLKVISTKFEMLSAEMEKRDKVYLEESALLQNMQNEAERLAAEYQRKDLAISRMKQELERYNEDHTKLHGELTVAQDEIRAKKDLLAKRETLLAEKELTFQASIRSIDEDCKAKVKEIEDKARCIKEDSDKHVELASARVAELESSKTMRFLDYAISEQEKLVKEREHLAEEHQRHIEQQNLKLEIETQERSKAEAEARKMEHAAHVITHSLKHKVEDRERLKAEAGRHKAEADKHRAEAERFDKAASAIQMAMLRKSGKGDTRRPENITADSLDASRTVDSLDEGGSRAGARVIISEASTASVTRESEGEHNAKVEELTSFVAEVPPVPMEETLVKEEDPTEKDNTNGWDPTTKRTKLKTKKNKDKDKDKDEDETDNLPASTSEKDNVDVSQKAGSTAKRRVTLKNSQKKKNKRGTAMTADSGESELDTPGTTSKPNRRATLRALKKSNMARASQNSKATTIQSVVRSWLARKHLSERVKRYYEQKRKHKAAVKIQSKYRQRLGARRVKRIRRAGVYQDVMVREIEVNIENHAASRKIQAMWRRKRTRDPVRKAAERASADMASFEGLGALPARFSTPNTSVGDSRPSTTSSTGTRKDDLFSPFTLRPLAEVSSKSTTPRSPRSPARTTPDQGPPRSPVSPKPGSRTNLDTDRLEAVMGMVDGEARVELLRTKQKMQGLQEMITEVSWRYRQAEVTIEDLNEVKAENLAHIEDLVKTLDEKNSYIDRRNADFELLRSILEEVERVSDEVRRQGEESAMKNEELEQHLIEYKDRNFHSLGYSRFLEEQLFEARKLQKQILQNQGRGAGSIRNEGDSDIVGGIGVTINRGHRSTARNSTTKTPGKYSPRSESGSPESASPTPTFEGLESDFSELFHPGGGGTAEGKVSASAHGNRAEGMEEDESFPGASADARLTEPSTEGKVATTLTPGANSTVMSSTAPAASLSHLKSTDDQVKTVSVMSILARLDTTDARNPSDKEGSGSSSDSDSDSDDSTDAGMDTKPEKMAKKEMLYAMTNEKAEVTLTDHAMDNLRNQQRALDEYSIRQEEYDKEMSTMALIESLKTRLREADTELTLRKTKIEELTAALQTATEVNETMQERADRRLEQFRMVRDIPKENAAAVFLASVAGEKKLRKRKVRLGQMLEEEAQAALNASPPFALLNLLLNEANKDAYFGGAATQIKEVVQVAFNTKRDLDQTAADIQVFLDERVAPAISHKLACRREIQKWLETYYNLTGRDPSMADKSSSLHFTQYAEAFLASQTGLDEVVSQARGMALLAEQKRYTYEACAHFIFQITGKRPPPFKFRFMVPAEHWSKIEDPLSVIRDGYDVFDVPQVDVCAVLSLIAPGLTTVSTNLVLPAHVKSQTETETDYTTNHDSDVKSGENVAQKEGTDKDNDENF